MFCISVIFAVFSDKGVKKIYKGETNEVKLCTELPHIDFRLFVTPNPLPNSEPPSKR